MAYNHDYKLGIVEEFVNDIYKKLYYVPLPSLKECLKKYIKEEEQQLKIDKYSKAETISKFRTLNLSSNIIEDIYNQYKLGKNLSFQLFYSDQPLSNFDFSLEKWNSENTIYDFAHIKYENLPKIKNIYFYDVEDIAGEIKEISYKYHVLHKYFNDKENEEPSYIYETQYGFLCINNKNNYVVIIAKEEKVVQLIRQQFKELFNVKLSQPQLTKEALNRIFLKENTKSATYTEPTGLTTKLSFASTAGDYYNNNQDNIIEKFEAAGTRKAIARYNETIIPEDLSSQSVISVNADKCKISVMKTYSTDQIRSWGQNKFGQITDELNNMKTSDITKYFNVFAKSILSDFHMSKNEINFIKAVSSSLYNALLKKENCEVPIIGVDYDSVKLSKFFNIVPLYDCPSCNTQHYAKCYYCENDLVWNEKFYCKDCKKEYGPKVFLKCDNNGTSNELNIYNAITLIPNSFFIDILSKFIIQSGIIYNNKQHHFYIKNNILFFYNSISEIEYSLTDISIFKDLCINLQNENINEYNALKRECINFPEKCKNSKKSDCQNCKNENTKYCLMKMFSYIIPSYKPQPHKGNEYGDASFVADINGNQKTIKVIMKRYEKNGPALISKGVGREIIIQVITQYLRDASRPILAILIPSGLDASLKQDIRSLVGFVKGKVIFIEEQEYIALYKMAKSNGFNLA